MWLIVFSSLLLASFRLVDSSYIALAPNQFHPGSRYAVQLTVVGVKNNLPVNIRGQIVNSQAKPLGDNNITLNNGESGKLEIQIPPKVEPDGYTLLLNGSGGLTFSNSTEIQLASISHFALIQTDKKIYKAEQLIRWRAVVLDKNLTPQKIPLNITLVNSKGSTLIKFNTDGSKYVSQGTYQLTEFPELGEYKIVVKTVDQSIVEELPFKVDEYVVPKFEVSAKVMPGFLVRSGPQKKITVSVTATYTYGKGVMGDVKLSIGEKQITMSRITDVSGKKDIEVDLSNELQEYSTSIAIKVEVIDETLRTYDTTTSVEVVSSPIKIKFDEARTDFVYRPKSALQVVVKVTDPMGLPLEAEYLENTLTLSLSDGDSPRIQRFSLSAGPIFTWDIPSLDTTSYGFSLQATIPFHGENITESIYITKYQTVGNATLDARWINYSPTLSIGSNLTFIVKLSSPDHFKSISYIIVSRGNIQAMGSVKAEEATSFKVTTDMCPKGQLIVYGITNDVQPEIIADSLQLKIELCQNKKVTPSASSKSLRTGSNATILVDVTWTDPNNKDSIGQHDVYLLGVDKGITMLEGDNDINPTRVETGLEKFNLPAGSSSGGGKMDWGRSFIPISNSVPINTGQLFEELGLKLLGDIEWKQQENRFWFEKGEVAFPAAEADVNRLGAVDDAAGGSTTDTVTMRKDFPDTFIWTSEPTNNMGHLSLEAKLPDSITSWIVSGFAVRDDEEIAVTDDPFEMIAFNSFFLNLNLPYSIRYSEKFELRATVFNYYEKDLTASVTLSSSKDFIISGESTKTISVSANTAGSVTFVIMPSKVGTITLTVTAAAMKEDGSRVTDIVTKDLIVKPQGVERMRAVTLPVILSAEQPSFEQDVTLSISPWTLNDVMQDSRRASVKVTGDMMGNALENIDKLLTMPTGCGEQNMITTVPNIFAMTYLTAIKAVSMDFAAKAKEYMKRGYTKETQEYRWPDGGYSAFGTTDKAASTWLTAFVVKSFSQAMQFIPETVDSDILDSDVKFIYSCINSSTGLFEEKGQVIHTEMQGGTGGGDALTAYIVICLLEAKKYGVEIDSSKLNTAISYVRQLADGNEVKVKQFLAAMAAYALALSAPTDTSVHAKVEQLIGYIDNDAGGAPWKKSGESPTVKPGDSWYYQAPPGPSDIEITAYCILAYCAISKVPQGRDLVLWLQKQQNSFGGYSSSQDTVMALQAISEYSAFFAGTNPGATVVVTPLDPSEASKTVTITGDNSILLQTVELPDETNKVRIHVTGNDKSTIMVKVVYYFNTAAETDDNPPGETGVVDNNNQKLMVTTSSSIIRAGLLNVQACMKRNPELDYDGMVLLTVVSPSGFELDDAMETRKANPIVARLEQENDQIHLYMNKPQDECVNIILEEKVKVENLKPGTAHLRAYYDPDIKSEAEILLKTCEGESCNTANGSSAMGTISLLLAFCGYLLLALIVAV